MRLGCCCALEQAEVAQAAGFDYLETTVVALMPEADETVWASLRTAYLASPLPIAVCNVFLPRDLKVVGPVVDRPRLARYVEIALDRVAEIGARRVVFGSGGARNLPEGFDRSRATAQLVEFLTLVADHAEAHGITLAIEPLNRQESNILNSVPEAVELARRVDRPSIRALADLYHMQVEGEPLRHIADAGEWLAHLHVADSGRGAPGTGSYPFAEFAAQVAASGYLDRGAPLLSVECRWENLAAEAPGAVRFLHTLWPA